MILWCQQVDLYSLFNHFGVTLAALLTCEVDFGATLGPLWGDFRIWGWLWSNFGATLGLLFALEGDFGGTLASLWSQCWHKRVTLGSLWGHFGATLGPLWVYGGDFGSLWDHYVMIVEALWVYEGPFSKNIHFPNRFKSFYKTTGWILERFGVALGVKWKAYR